ncbi:MAG: GEVED domain-containing protein, partial [Candidatus Altiarchaeota archaeon]|nr:GEVED domain-containing protein [Candidatus Altiarchaeota archaeon]
MVNKNKLTLILLGMILIALTGCVTHEDVFVNGTVNITGSALSSGMEGYVIEVGQGMDPTSWTTLGVVLTDEGNLNINESLLAVWNTSAVSNGKHTIRLTVTDSNGVSSQDLIYVTVDNINDTPTLPCPTWSCDGLVEGLNSVDVGLTPEQYGCNMNCSITCECPNNMHMVVNSTGDLEYSYDFLYLDATSHTGSWSGSDSFNDTVDILFSSDHSLDGSSGYAGFNITGITCTPYCLSQSSYYSSEYIERVELNTGVSSSSGSCYSDHTSPVLTTLVTGHSYTLYVDVSTTYLYTEYVKAWIDFNHDFDFSDTGEEINLGSYGVDGTYTFSKDFTVPAGAIYGNTRMRVSAKWSSAPLPCGLFSYGEVEDYTVWISSSVTT